jgi:hypothetical protein
MAHVDICESLVQGRKKIENLYTDNSQTILLFEIESKAPYAEFIRLFILLRFLSRYAVFNQRCLGFPLQDHNHLPNRLP